MKLRAVMNKSRIRFLLSVIVASIGAIGQAYLLYHELSDCYPYKVMSFPPAEFYSQVAAEAIFVAPVIAIIVGLLFDRKRHWLALVLPVVFCPAVFIVIFLANIFARRWNGIEDLGRNF